MRNARNNKAINQSKLRGKKLLLEILAVCVALAALALALAYTRRDPPPPPEPPPPDAALEGIDIETVSDWDSAYITVYYPHTENAQVNQAVQAFVDEKIAQFQRGAQPGARGKDELTVSLKVTRFDDDIVSFLFRSYTRYASDARGRDSIDAMTFDLATGEQYDLASLFRKSETDEYLQTLSRLAFDGLRDLAVYQASELETSILRKGTAPGAENFTYFALDGDTLRLHFPPMQIGSGANAVDRFDVPLGPLRHLLSRRILAPKRGGVSEPQSTDPPTQPPPTENSGPQTGKLVALTFDDGPHPEITPLLLDFLQGQGVHVTFFVLGCNVVNTPDILRRAAAEGHQIGSHTYGHKNLTTLSAERRQSEIERNAALIEELTGKRPTVMRPPFGEQNAALQNAVNTPLLLWSVDPKDWSTRDADRTFRHVLERVKDGDIVLLHDVYPESLEAAKRIIPALLAQGYTFVTVDQLFAARGGAQPGDVVRNRP